MLIASNAQRSRAGRDVVDEVSVLIARAAKSFPHETDNPIPTLAP